MFKHAPVLLGTISGLACGAYANYWMPPDAMPLLRDLVTGMVRFMLERGCDSAQVLAFAYCGLPLVCGALGAGLGAGVAAVLQKRRARGGLYPASGSGATTSPFHVGRLGRAVPEPRRRNTV